MEFDKSKVFTVFNCDEVKIGSKGYFADSKEDLITRVQSENKDLCWTLDNVRHNTELPFDTNGCTYHYFYLVEEPKEKIKRPCTREELVEMLREQGLPMLKSVNIDCVYAVVCISEHYVYVHSAYDYSQTVEYTPHQLCESYTLLDGTPLWIKE